MSEPILIALVQLFAIVAASRHRQLSENTRLIIESYLKQYLSTKELEEYLMLYDELFSFHTMNEDDFDWATPVTLEKMQEICVRINKGLHQKDKVIVFIKFVEFIETIRRDNTDNKDEGKEQEYYKKLCSAFNLSDEEYSYLIGFLLNPFNSKLDDNDVLVISCSPDAPKSKFKHMVRERLEGYILVLNLKSIDTFIGRYIGFDELYLNGHYIALNQSFIVNSGSIIKNQKIIPVYYADIASEMLYLQQNVKLQFAAEGIAYTFKNSSNGIKPFSFNADTGELVGVIGGSGAGKSTLLSLLNGTLPLEQGNIYINGHDIAEENERVKGIIGYIPQDDFLIEELTVFQNLYYNARLCYSHYSRFKLIRIILKVLHDVDLMDIRDLVVGSPLKKVISGGQRKRLNIALELIREPYLLFADEPTSGLSSMDSEMVMLLLKEQTLKGRIVMVNIHQPSTIIFKLFDKLLFLDKGGYPIYYGNPLDSLTYFKSACNYVNPSESECLSCGYVNPEQLFEITESKTINKHGKVTKQRIHNPADWYTMFKKKVQPYLLSEKKTLELPTNNFSIPGKLSQFSIFSIRNLFIKLTNRQYVLLNLLEAPFLALILAYLTRYSSADSYLFGQNKNIVAYLFMSVVVALFLGMMVSAEEIIKDRKILKREAFLNLSWLSYLNSKILFLFLLSAIQSLLYVLVGSVFLGVYDTMLSYWLILFTTSCFANMIGLNISAGFNSVVNIYIVIPFVLVPQLLLSGVIVPFDTLNKSISSNKEVPIIGDIMASRWAYEALAVTQFTNNCYSKHFYQYDKELSNLAYVNSYLIPSIKSVVDESYRDISLNRNTDTTKVYLSLVRNEIEKMQRFLAYPNQTIIDKIYIDKLSDKQRLETHSHLDSLATLFGRLRTYRFKERDSVYQALANTIGEDAILHLKHKSYNNSLAEWVLNKRSKEKILVSTKGFIRKKDPIYMEPESRIGRAHFYAPAKYLGELRISTLWFNVLAIWFMSGVLYITLWKNSLARILSYFSLKARGKMESKISNSK